MSVTYANGYIFALAQLNDVLETMAAFFDWPDDSSGLADDDGSVDFTGLVGNGYGLGRLTLRCEFGD